MLISTRQPIALSTPRADQSSILLADALSSRKNRLNRLYWIQNEQGEVVRFQPNYAQAILEEQLWWLNLVLKSRQHGVTTWACVRALDTALFRPNSRCGIIAHKRDDAAKFFRQKILFAYEHMPPEFREMVSIVRRDMTGVVEFSNGSSIEVSVSHRGGTFQFLHISEYGPLCGTFPERADEVKSGALNTVHEKAIVTIESTAYGREGDFFDRCERAQQLDALIKAGQATLTRMDYRFFFFAWYDDPRNRLDEDVYVSDELFEYFEQLEHLTGKIITQPQRAWYVKKAEDQGAKMKREHPSTPDEAFESSHQLQYYANEMALLREKGQICTIPFAPSVPVNTFWDLGRNDLNAIWFHQQVGVQHRFISYYENRGESLAHYAKYLIDFKAKHNIIYGDHYLPHDAAVVDISRSDNLSREAVLNSLGIKPTIIVDRIDNLSEGVEMTRQVLPLCYFEKDHCKAGLEWLDKYKKHWNAQQQSASDTPAKTDARNAADALRQFAQGYQKRPEKKQKKSAPKNWRTL